MLLWSEDESRHDVLVASRSAHFPRIERLGCTLEVQNSNVLGGFQGSGTGGRFAPHARDIKKQNRYEQNTMYHLINVDRPTYRERDGYIDIYI